MRIIRGSLAIAFAIVSLDFGLLRVLRDDARLSRRGHLPEISGALVIAQIPWERPVIRADDGNPSVLALSFVRDLLHVSNEVQRATPRARVNIEVIGTLVVVVNDVDIVVLIRAHVLRGEW